jgi:hypothetical protein
MIRTWRPMRCAYRWQGILTLAIAWGALPLPSLWAQALIVQNPGWFESWAFQGQPEPEVRRQLLSQVQLQLKAMEKQCSLTADQKQKLETAAQGDIARFFRMVQLARLKTEGMQPDQEHMQQIQQALSPVQSKFIGGLFKKDSLLETVTSATLTPDQMASWRRYLQERLERRYATAMAIELSRLEQRLPLTSRQREAILEKVASRCKGRSIKDDQRLIALVEAAFYSIPKEDLAQILDPPQLALLQKESQSRAGIIEMMKQEGFDFEAVRDTQVAPPDPTQETPQ